ncbi:MULTISPECIES: ATP-binding protein [unclassified Alcanivorax]|mgnify:FL=1|jgi:signal transduction histidine kinase|uniref:sensor histidine kinase n=1 Tax=unclassified Alcanivorax TaxID=2638842 RepID=UPI0008A073C0|nr:MULTISPECIES: ATP-binding protein [unclassified Alcanivorax]MBU83529.1 hypothetical protein [Alcanivorax sp.]SEF84516.1 Signal transduction histidine kinase [Alcanivorax sp. DSM 26293]
MRTICLWFLLSSLLYSGLLSADTAFTRITQGQYLYSEKPTSQLPDGDWKDTTLPFAGSYSQIHGTFWFRFNLDSLPDAQRDSLLVSNHVFDISIFLNGHMVAGTQRLDGRESTGWNHPFYTRLPAAYWLDSGNQLIIRIRSGEPNAVLSPLIIGDQTVLQSHYQQSVFQKIRIAEWSMVTCIVMGSLTLFIWLLRRSDRLYLYFSLLCFSWSAVMFYMAVPFAPINHGTWLRFVFYCVDLSGFFLFMFLYRLMQLDRPRLKILAIAALILSGIVLFIMPMRLHTLVITFVHGMHLALVIYLLVIGTHLAIRKRSKELLLLIPGFLVISLLVLHDIYAFQAAAQQPGRLPEGTFMQYGFAVLLILIFAHLVRTFVRALNHSETLNSQLETRVAEISASLEKSYAENHALALYNHAQQERQKVYRDLHDDVGAKLLSILHSRAEHEKSSLAREALSSLRETVNQSRQDIIPLNELIANAITESENRLSHAGIQFHYNGLGDIPDTPADPTKAYHLSRILRELTSNIIKHADTGTAHLDCRIHHANDSSILILTIRDEGPGLSEEMQQRGMGLANIRHRAQEIGATVGWESDNNTGCLCRLEVPLRAMTLVA